jgi:hypothetical protein
MRAHYLPKIEKNMGYPYKDLYGFIGGASARLLNPWALNSLNYEVDILQKKNGITAKELCKDKKWGYGTPSEKAC